MSDSDTGLTQDDINHIAYDSSYLYKSCWDLMMACSRIQYIDGSNILLAALGEGTTGLTTETVVVSSKGMKISCGCLWCSSIFLARDQMYLGEESWNSDYSLLARQIWNDYRHGFPYIWRVLCIWKCLSKWYNIKQVETAHPIILEVIQSKKKNLTTQIDQSH